MRNRLRVVLRDFPQISESLINIAEKIRELRSWVAESAPVLSERFVAVELEGWPKLLATEAARKWLMGRGAPAGELRPKVLERFVEFVTDAAVGMRREFPGKVLVRRRKAWIEAE